MLFWYSENDVVFSLLFTSFVVHMKADACNKDVDDLIWVDRDPEIFSLVLNFLRYGVLPQLDKSTEARLCIDADYYLLPDLKYKCFHRQNGGQS